MDTENIQPQKQSIKEQLSAYKDSRNETTLTSSNVIANSVALESTPRVNKLNQAEFENTMSRETDTDLMTSFEIVKLPSKGYYYANGLSEVNVEYMTSVDEDLLTTPSLIDSGTVLDLLLKRKIKTKGVNPEDLLVGDRNAIILYLRSSSYGSDYTVQVTDPRNGTPFKTTVDLLKLKYKEVKEYPNDHGLFTVELPMRKKMVKFKLLTSGEETSLFKKAEAQKEAYGNEFNQYSTMKLKSHVVSIDDKTDRTYINKFIDAMPALDAFTIRKKIMEVSPDVDMEYMFTTKDGYTFNANLSIGLDFFFPNT